MLAIQLIMPSEGDMSLVKQEGGTITLQPVYYGGECSGPHIRVVELNKDGTVSEVTQRFRMKIKSDGRIELKRGETAEEVTK